MFKPNQTFLLITIFFLLLFGSVSCGTMDQYYKTQENLDLSIKAFNFEFESKAMNSSARFVHPSQRAYFMGKSMEMTQRVTFYEATVLDIKFFKNGIPSINTSKGPEKGFDRAVVVIRYQVAVLPSTKLKSLIIEHEWVLNQGQWSVIPDLDSLLN